MGGNIWKNQSLRLEKTEYFKYCEQVTSILHNFGIIENLHIVEALRDKTDFGDMDIVLSVKPNQDLITPLRCLLDDAGYATSTNGNVLSFLFNSFQIDLICVPQAQYDYACKYFSFNDLGNVAGRMLKQYGFKHGWNGLYYVQRNGDHVVKEHLLSINYLDIINILGLDKYKFFHGFNDYEDMFNWLVKSPLFISSIFKYENLNHTNKVRDRKRKVYNLFLDYIDKLDDSIKNKEVPKLSEEEKRSFVFSKFPKLALEVERLDKEIEIHNIIKLKFNGELVKSLTGLSGAPLGDFIKLFKSSYNDNWIFNTPQYEINLLIKKIYQNLQ